MVRGLIASGVVIATAVESVSAEPDLFKYAITQGGLLAVVLVLLWSYRKDLQRITQRDEEKLALLTDLVSSNTKAMTSLVERIDRGSSPR